MHKLINKMFRGGKTLNINLHEKMNLNITKEEIK